jgi:hypothetical protein
MTGWLTAFSGFRNIGCLVHRAPFPFGARRIDGMAREGYQTPCRTRALPFRSTVAVDAQAVANQDDGCFGRGID